MITSHLNLLNLSLLASIVVSQSFRNDGLDEPTLHARSDAPTCSNAASEFTLADAPYANYFYADCNVAAQVITTSPLSDSNLTIIGPRLIVAWPAGNSGVCTYYAPQNGVNGTLSIEMVNSTLGSPLAPVYEAPSNGSAYPSVGVQAVLRFNSSATLTVSILGSIRTIRDFTEGPSLLYAKIQDAIGYTSNSDGSVTLQRLWLDNTTTTSLTFTPWSSASKITLSNTMVNFTAGDYTVSAQMNYPQMTGLEGDAVLDATDYAELEESMPGQVSALSFLSYSEKLLAGAWRFLTYFGRDSMISALLLEPVLSKGNGSAMEAVIGAVLERINRTDGSVCHEETIGDYATWTNLEDNITSSAMACDYKMIDSDYYLPVLMDKYFVQSAAGQNRSIAFFSTSAGTINAANQNLTWGQLALINAERIMKLAAPFAREPSKSNLVHLKDGQIVGEWRDSSYGIGGGRIPYDVNTALMPAALRSIAVLSRQGVYPNHHNWACLADEYAQVWEDKTLAFFETVIGQKQAQSLVESYSRDYFSGPNQNGSIDTDVIFHALSLDGYDNLTKVEVMNSDDSFRHFLLNTTNDEQLTRFLNSSASNVRRTFPAGLMTSAGMVVANPAFGQNSVYAQNWTTGAYHGTVVWSWTLAMMAKGLELQLARCQNGSATAATGGSTHVPAFCRDSSVYDNVKTAYNTLWDTIEANSDQLSMEVWSWVYEDDDFQVTALGTLPAPPGVGSQTESDIRQLWSLSFLAVTRNQDMA